MDTASTKGRCLAIISCVTTRPADSTFRLEHSSSSMWALCFVAASLLTLASALPAPETDVCSLPSETGFCRAFVPRVFFNTASNKCEWFVYGGCGGNANNFHSFEECRSRCDRCYQPKDLGYCLGFIARSFYNPETYKCEMGCNRNENNFGTQAACQEACETPIRQSCLLPPNNGSSACFSNEPRFFYNSDTGTCESFNYSGCLGNDNNFETEEKCQAACAQQ